MLLRLTDSFAPTRPLPSRELERLRADVALASVAAIYASGADADDAASRPDAEPAPSAASGSPCPKRRSRRRRNAFDLDPRLRAADLRAQERALTQRR